MVLVALFLSCGWLGSALGFWSQTPPEVLFNAADFPKGWLAFSTDKASKITDTWQVNGNGENAELKCLGKPFGYIRTKKEYENFVFELEWMYPKNPNANSGVLIHTSGVDKIWPKSIQVQLHRPTAGSIFPSGGAMTKNTVSVKDPQLKIKQWHKCVITCIDGTISVVINGKKAGEVTGCDPKKGSIALQSEGSVLHFRRLLVRHLK